MGQFSPTSIHLANFSSNNMGNKKTITFNKHILEYPLHSSLVNENLPNDNFYRDIVMNTSDEKSYNLNTEWLV